MRVHSIARGAAAYCLEIAAEGVEGPGRWLGRGADRLGLSGDVAAPDLSAVLGGRHPASGQTLHVRPVQVPGVELLVQVPKSVSVLWAVAGADVAREVEAARTAALVAAVDYLEDEALVLGASRQPAGMVGAAFSHRTSRHGDPHLHTHLIVANLGPRERDDGSVQWLAVDRLVLSKHMYAAGHLFEAQLRHELSGRLGVRFGPVRSGAAQLEGVPEEVCRLFSGRRLQVEAIMAAHGGSSPAAARLAALIDRPDRDPELVADLLGPEWQQRARDAGFGPDALRGVLGSPARQPLSGEAAVLAARPQPVEPGRILDALDRAGASSFSRRDVLRAVCAEFPDGVRADRARAVVDEVLASPGAVRLTGRSTLRREDVVRKEDGRLIVVRTDQERWTTRTELELRRRATELAECRRTDSRTALAAESAPVLSAECPGLRPAEEAVADRLLTSAQGVQLLAAAAGPERDRVLAACRRAWSDGGVRVVGATVAPEAGEPSAAGAGTQSSVLAPGRLETSTGIEASDIDAVVGRLSTLAAPVVAPTVLVVTGAERLASAQLVRLLETARRTEVSVVLVADLVQLPEIDRSGGFRAVADATGSLALARSSRSVNPELRSPELRPPSELVQAPSHPPGRDSVSRVGERLVLSPSPDALRDRMVDDWYEAWRGGSAVGMVATGRADVEDLNARARSLLERHEVLTGPPRPLGGLPVRGGDRVVVAGLDARARRRGWEIGQSWTVEADGLRLTAPSGPTRGVEEVGGVSLRWAYASTPYQAGRAATREWLVLGAPASLSAAGPAPPTRPRFYVVVGLEQSAALTTGLSRIDPAGQRAELLGHAAELDPPARLLESLGPLPADPDGRRAWRRAAGAAEAYRERWGVTDPRTALGEEPGPGSRDAALRRAEHREVGGLLARTSAGLERSGGRGPEQGPDRRRDQGREPGPGREVASRSR